MKKSLIALLTVALVVVFYGMAMAALATGDIAVNADVPEYAEINGLAPSLTMNVTYDGNGYYGSTSDLFSVESNCGVTVSAPSSVTLTKTDEPNLPATVTLSGTTSSTAKGTLTPTITLTVDTSEAISARSAGDYAGTVTVTVSVNTP